MTAATSTVSSLPLREALDAIPVGPVFLAGFTLPIWGASLQSYSEVAHSITLTLVMVLAAYKLWQAWRDRNEGTMLDRGERVAKASAGVAGAVAKSKIGWLGFGAVATTVAVLMAALVLAPKRADAATLPPVANKAGRRRSADDAGEDGPEVQPTVDPNWPAWYALAHADLGVVEGAGRRNNPTVLAYYKDAGHSEIRDDETAWCAAFVGAQLERAGISCTKSITASSYDTWGEDASASPRVGDVVRLWRESPRSWKGHVGFYAGETPTHVLLLGGNQSDKVSVAPFLKSRIKAIRRPRSLVKSKTMAGGATAVASGAGTAAAGGLALNEVLSEAPAAIDAAAAAGDKVAGPLMQTGTPKLATIALCIIVGCAVLSVAGGLLAMWARVRDRKTKGV